ncbi:MAG: DUF2141 domain-containing protein [Pseudomonadota bacterium]
MLETTLLGAAHCTRVALRATASDIRFATTVTEAAGERLGCALHDAATAFPTGQNVLALMWRRPSDDSAACVFPAAPGTAAVALAENLNARQMTDPKAIGLPRDDRGASLNVRPALQEPGFSELAFEVAKLPASIAMEIV